MEWGREQETALGRVADWMHSDQQVFRLFGYAGTGKTTLAKHLAEGVEGAVLFAAYTGKAAHVLRTKGCPATTIHSLIYHSRDKGRAHLQALELELAELMHELRIGGREPEGAEGSTDEDLERHPGVIALRTDILNERRSLARPAFALNQDSPVRDAALVVIDECSMVDGSMGQDLLSFGTKVLVLGDPAQLPPVGGAGFFTEGVKPDVMLEAIHRQAAGNPIIAMASRVREGQALEPGLFGSSRVITRSDLSPDAVLEAGQLLVGRNKTRNASNRRIRTLRGFQDELPEQGDRLVCLRNNHDLGLLNGMIWTCEDASPLGSDLLFLTIRSDDTDALLECEAHDHYFRGKGDKLGWWEKKDAQEFDYGYALTCHKAQGSQWEDVMIFDESSAFRENRHRWLYTAITRAAERVTVVKM